MARRLTELSAFLSPKVDAMVLGVRRLWFDARFRVVGPPLFRVATAVLTIVLGVVIGSAIHFSLGSPGHVNDTIADLIRIATGAAVANALVVAVLTWATLRAVVHQCVAVFLAATTRGRRLFEVVVRLLSSLPTLIVGNAFLVTTSWLGLAPTSRVGVDLYLIFAFTTIGVPTAFQIGKELTKDYDKRQLQHARALGMSDLSIAHQLVLPSLRRTMSAAMTLAVGRVIIEGYVVISRTSFQAVPQAAPIATAKDLISLFNKLYTTMTVQSNVGLIVLMFGLALFANFWGMGGVFHHGD